MSMCDTKQSQEQEEKNMTAMYRRSKNEHDVIYLRYGSFTHKSTRRQSEFHLLLMAEFLDK